MLISLFLLSVPRPVFFEKLNSCRWTPVQSFFMHFKLHLRCHCHSGLSFSTMDMQSFGIFFLFPWWHAWSCFGCVRIKIVYPLATVLKQKISLWCGRFPLLLFYSISSCTPVYIYIYIYIYIYTGIYILQENKTYPHVYTRQCVLNTNK